MCTPNGYFHVVPPPKKKKKIGLGQTHFGVFFLILSNATFQGRGFWFGVPRELIFVEVPVVQLWVLEPIRIGVVQLLLVVEF